MKCTIGHVSSVAYGCEWVGEMDHGVVVGDRKNLAGVADKETSSVICSLDPFAGTGAPHGLAYGLDHLADDETFEVVQVGRGSGPRDLVTQDLAESIRSGVADEPGATGEDLFVVEVVDFARFQIRGGAVRGKDEPMAVRDGNNKGHVRLRVEVDAWSGPGEMLEFRDEPAGYLAPTNVGSPFLNGEKGIWSADGVKIEPGDTQAAPVSKEVDMIDWLLDVLGFGQAEPGDEPEAGPVIIING